MARKITFSQRFRYWFDNLISKGTPALILLLLFGFALASILSGLIIYLSGIETIRSNESSLAEAIWSGFTHVIDPGTIGGDTDWHLRLGMFLGTLFGVFLISSLVSILNQGFGAKIAELKKGRSLVLEEDHIVILGWSGKVSSIIHELMIAHENQSKSCVVILAEEDVDMMKDDIAHRIGNTGKTKIIFRHGNPRDSFDIHIPNINTAKSIIILSPEEDKSDSFVIKTILAIVNHKDRKPEKYNIIAEIKESENKQIAQLAGGDEVTVVVSDDIIAKITVQTSRQTGLSLIYNDLIDFENVEIYILPVKNAEGHTFKKVSLNLEEASVIGIRHEDGTIKLNPPSDYIIKRNDKLVVICEDDFELEYKERYNPVKDPNVKIIDKIAKTKQKQRTLILGWNKKSAIILKEFDNYILEGSEVLVIAEGEGIKEQIDELKHELKNQVVKFSKGNINNRKILEAANLKYYNDIIICSYSDKYGIQEADAITLITLMHIRDIVSRENHNVNIVSEMMDSKNRALADLYKVEDFIVSDIVISDMLAQLAENKELSYVFEDLFDSDDNEIYLKPAEYYVEIGQEVDMLSLYEVAFAKKEICIGYKQKKYANQSHKAYGIVLNPKKTDKITFEEGDKIIVIAED
jgi:Trk K+ transport system NAD-binding subunit/ABC-type transporter Mla MlaB component